MANCLRNYHWSLHPQCLVQCPIHTRCSKVVMWMCELGHSRTSFISPTLGCSASGPVGQTAGHFLHKPWLSCLCSPRQVTSRRTSSVPAQYSRSEWSPFELVLPTLILFLSAFTQFSTLSFSGWFKCAKVTALTRLHVTLSGHQWDFYHYFCGTSSGRAKSARTGAAVHPPLPYPPTWTSWGNHLVSISVKRGE